MLKLCFTSQTACTCAFKHNQSAALKILPTKIAEKTLIWYCNIQFLQALHSLTICWWYLGIPHFVCQYITCKCLHCNALFQLWLFTLSLVYFSMVIAYIQFLEDLRSLTPNFPVWCSVLLLRLLILLFCWRFFKKWQMLLSFWFLESTFYLEIWLLISNNGCGPSEKLQLFQTTQKNSHSISVLIPCDCMWETSMLVVFFFFMTTVLQTFILLWLRSIQSWMPYLSWLHCDLPQINRSASH